MKVKYTKEQLIKFEQDIASHIPEIKAPVHCRGGNEQELLEIFKSVGEDDYVFATWASHYEFLLKGVPPEELKAAILAGKSITLCFPQYKCYSSAMCGGICPIALGAAMGIKRRGGKEHVWCFIGDMVARSGIFEECLDYRFGHQLPITFVIGDNGLSVMTPTKEVWQCGCSHFPEDYLAGVNKNGIGVWYYKYQNTFPHSGNKAKVAF